MNAKLVPLHRKVVVVWHLLILAMLLWMITRPGDGEDLHWIWIPVMLSPALAIVASLAPLRYQARAVAYWLMAAITIPTALGGLTSLVGPAYIISILLLIWAARRENPATEMVQM